jgi:phosphate butyryltransferase
MSKIATFADLDRLAKSQPSKRLVLAMAQEGDSLKAACNAAAQQIVDPVLVGDPQAIQRVAEEEGVDIGGYRLLAASSEAECAAQAVQLIRSGEGDVLMKGRVSTANLMRAVLASDSGLKASPVLSHVTIVEIDTYHKLLFMSDPGLNIAPDLATKIAILRNAVAMAHRFGVSRPKVAVITAVEKVNPESMPATVDAAVLAKMSDRGQIEGCVVDGPFALDNALSAKSCEIKGIKTEVGGDADILLMPDIEAANVFYKTLAFLTNAKVAGLITGAKVPIVLPSRSDSDSIKYLSILAAVIIA